MSWRKSPPSGRRKLLTDFYHAPSEIWTPVHYGFSAKNLKVFQLLESRAKTLPLALCKLPLSSIMAWRHVSEARFSTFPIFSQTWNSDKCARCANINQFRKLPDSAGWGRRWSGAGVETMEIPGNKLFYFLESPRFSNDCILCDSFFRNGKKRVE